MPDGSLLDAARIGPNAILQMAEALRAGVGEVGTRDVFAEAGLIQLLDDPPETMVDERLVERLHGRVAATLEPDRAEAIALDAGRRTAAYILANRIPAPVRWLLHALPAGPAARLLTDAIGRHAWTFAGSGRFTAHGRWPALTLEIADNPVATPGCPWHRGVFEGLYGTLVSRDATVRMLSCCALGADACRFRVERGSGPAPPAGGAAAFGPAPPA